MTEKQKQHLLAFLGYYTGTVDGIWGAQSKNATERFQRDCGLPPDGVFGDQTAEAVLEAVYTYDMNAPVPDENVTDINVGNKNGTFWDEIEFFDPDEMRCKCGGKYCSGFPHEIKPLLMQILDRARRWSGHPIQVISGLRCKEWNRIQKGVATSQHQYGEAVDVYFYGKTPASALAWLQSQPDVRYAYPIEGCNNIHFDIQPDGR
jgi:peptidoglycan hydrolase-like protein with peptidoglycan-binding domain